MAGEHEWRDCFHPTTQQGGDGCHLFMRCHGTWPERCDLSERDHQESDAEKIERLTALLAERDARIAALVEAGVVAIDCLERALGAQRPYTLTTNEEIRMAVDTWRAALAAAGGEGAAT